ncbi:TetR/AcrR family transcriptional regulator [soil metagenome]
MAAVLSGGTRNAILEAATRLFGGQGYAGTTMRDIASAVGVLPGSLYTHIDGKETLLREIVESGIDKFLGLGYAAVAGDDSAEIRLRNLIKGHVAIIAQNPDRTLVVFHQWRFLTGEQLARVVEKRRQYELIISTVIEDGFTSGGFDSRLERNIAVKSMLGALNWTAEWFRPDGPETAAEIGDQMADVIVNGLKTR